MADCLQMVNCGVATSKACLFPWLVFIKFTCYPTGDNIGEDLISDIKEADWSVVVHVSGVSFLVK